MIKMLDWYEIDLIKKIISEKIKNGCPDGVSEAWKLVELDEKLNDIRRNTLKPDDWDC
jgi:hypothetical protein